MGVAVGTIVERIDCVSDSEDEVVEMLRLQPAVTIKSRTTRKIRDFFIKQFPYQWKAQSESIELTHCNPIFSSRLAEGKAVRSPGRSLGIG